MISDIESLILGLISYGDNYGYAIEKAIEVSNMREWTEVAFSSIYTILRRLKKDGLITSKRETVNGRSRNIYVITEKGKEAQVEKIINNLRTKEKVISSFDAAVTNLDKTPKDTIIQSLHEYINSINDRIERYIVRLDQIETRIIVRHPDRFFLRALCERHITMLEAEKEYIVSYIKEIEKHME